MDFKEELGFLQISSYIQISAHTYPQSLLLPQH